MPLDVGAPAPEFTLPDQYGQPISLSETLADKSVLLVFYPFAFSGVCTGELNGFRDRLGDFETDTTTLLTISCDPMYSLRAFADRDGLFFPLLSDHWPHGEVTSAYGVFDETHGHPKRSSYVIGRDGNVAWAVHNAPGDARDLDEQADRLAALV